MIIVCYRKLATTKRNLYKDVDEQGKIARSNL